MAISLYQKDINTEPHRGAIYEFRPVFWLEPPLWILRDVRLSPPRQANIYPENEVQNAFRLINQNNEEDIMARAKKRPVVILSSDLDISSHNNLVVAPIYSLSDKSNKGVVERIRNSEYPEYFYLPKDIKYPNLEEGYINFRKVFTIHKGFLEKGKLYITFTSETIKAILYRYLNYLRQK
jgi:hypothetical protein